MTRAPLPPHTTAIVADSIRHAVNEQCRPLRDAEGRMTFQTECRAHIVYHPKWRDHEADSIDCPKCFSPGGPDAP